MSTGPSGGYVTWNCPLCNVGGIGGDEGLATHAMTVKHISLHHRLKQQLVLSTMESLRKFEKQHNLSSAAKGGGDDT